MSCHLLNAYTKFQIDILKHVEKIQKIRTDGQTDGHRHGIIRPFFKRVYKMGPKNIYTGFLLTIFAYVLPIIGLNRNIELIGIEYTLNQSLGKRGSSAPNINQ